MKLSQSAAVSCVFWFLLVLKCRLKFSLAHHIQKLLNCNISDVMCHSPLAPPMPHIQLVYLLVGECGDREWPDCIRCNQIQSCTVSPSCQTCTVLIVFMILLSGQMCTCYWPWVVTPLPYCFDLQIMKYISRKAGKLCKCFLVFVSVFLEYECALAVRCTSAH